MYRCWEIPLETFQRLKKPSWKHPVLPADGQMVESDRSLSTFPWKQTSCPSADLMSWVTSLREGSYNVRSYWGCWDSLPHPNTASHAALLQDPHCDTTTLTIVAAQCFRYISHLLIESFVLVPPLVVRSIEFFLPSVFSWKIYREQPGVARMHEHGDGLFPFVTSPLLHTAPQSISEFLFDGVFTE